MNREAGRNLIYCKDEARKVLIVEGKNDCHGIYQIASQHGLQDLFGIWAGDSDDKALKRFSGLLVSTDAKPAVMGLVLDCDTRLSGAAPASQRRWDQVRARLEGSGYDIPITPSAEGTILAASEGRPRIGVWLMPSNAEPGMFEDFLLTLVPQRASTFARRVVQLARAKQCTSYKDAHFSKAVVHTYLAWQDEPGQPIGIAVKCGAFDSKGDAAHAFVKWLETLFKS